VVIDHIAISPFAEASSASAPPGKNGTFLLRSKSTAPGGA
jgi:hypothetical protein